MSSARVLMTVSLGSVALMTRRICFRLETLCSALLAMERSMWHMVTGLKPGGGGDMAAEVIEGGGVNLSLLRRSLLSTGCGPESGSETRRRHAGTPGGPGQIRMQSQTRCTVYNALCKLIVTCNTHTHDKRDKTGSREGLSAQFSSVAVSHTRTPHTRTHARTHARAHPRTHILTHTYTHTHTHLVLSLPLPDIYQDPTPPSGHTSNMKT